MAALLLSCTEYVDRYVIRVPIVGEPTMVIVPMSTSDADMKAADDVAGMVLDCGVAVLERPPLVAERKAFESEAGSSGLAVTGSGGIGGASGSSRMKGDVVTSCDPVELLSRTEANFVMFVRSEPDRYWLRIVKRDSGRVLYSGPFKVRFFYNTEQADYILCVRRMWGLLASAGIVK